MEHDEAMEHGHDEDDHPEDSHDEEGHQDDDGGHDHEDEEDHSVGRVPNNGSVIRIVSPADGAEIEVGSDIVVEVETENFELGEEGRHWHIFVDGQSRGMIMGHDFDEVLRGLEPGEHEIATTMSIDTHEELEEGDSITITIVE